jgi:hypothetical protein
MYPLFLLLVLFTGIFLPFFLTIPQITIILILQHLAAVIIVLKRAIQYSAENEKLKLFHFVFLLSELSTAIKFYLVTVNVKTGVFYFFLTTAFGVLIGIYFLFYNEKNTYEVSIK